jgi:hypothetical protein
MPIGHVALTVAALFSGAAIYVNVVEHPARLALDDRAALVEWKASYDRASVMQASLAIIGAVLAIIAWWQVRDWHWLVGGLMLAAPWPWTLLVIMPTNRVLHDTDPDAANAATRALIERWARLHAGRTAFGVGATLLMLWAALR